MYIPMQYSEVSGVNIYQQIPFKLSTEFSLVYTNTFFSDSFEDKSQVNICVNYACKVIPKNVPSQIKDLPASFQFIHETGSSCIKS